MKLAIRMTLVVLCATPLTALAQSNGLTRQQVREDLVKAERAGYRPSEHDAQYPGSFLDIKEGIYTGSSVYRTQPGYPNLAPNAESYLR
ncbi:membrane protein [Caballeronia peredens]|nr:membrane protein [Caballeronia peredens]